MKKKWILLLTIAAAILLSLCVLCAHPILLGGADLPAQEREAILSQAKGVYSDRLWLVPVLCRWKRSGRKGCTTRSATSPSVRWG